jgi:hypothetical protein
VKSYERRHNMIAKARILILQGRSPEALTMLERFDREYCSAPLRKENKPKSNAKTDQDEQEQVE